MRYQVIGPDEWYTVAPPHSSVEVEISMDSSRQVRFGVYELDLRSGELRKSGTRLSLQQQPLQLLAVLLERPGELVTRDDLRKRLWPDDTFVDFEHGLNAAVRRLRDTLGDSADSPRFVETVPRRGYRFIAPVSVEGAHSSNAGSKTAIRPVAVPRVKRGWLLLAAGLAVGIGGLWIYSSEDPRVSSTSHLTAVPFTTLPGQEVAPTFSPDGSQIAFAWAAEGLQEQFDLYVKVIGSEKVLRLTTRPADFIFPAWSPDGRQIAFGRLARGESGIYLVSPLGGSERKLADAPLFDDLQAMLSWSPDGKSLAFFDREPSGRFGISQVDIETLEKRWWGNPSPDCVWSWAPAFSPDGTLLAVGCKTRSTVTQLFVWPTAGGAGRLVASVEGFFTGLTWTADGGSLIFAASGDLWRVAASGGQPEKLLAGRDAAMPVISHDGQRLAYVKGSIFNVNLWQVSLTAPTRPAGPPERLLASSGINGYAAFSPDGRRVAFTSNRSGSSEVWTSDGDGSNAVALTAFGGPLTGSPEWSPDGRLIAFDSLVEGLAGIYVVRSEGGPHRRVATGVGDSSEPAWSTDGKWLYFGGRIKGVLQIFKVATEGGAAIQLTTGGGFAPQTSADGTRIYFSSLRGIYSVSTAGRDEQRLQGLPPQEGEFVDAWGLSPTGVYFINPAAPRAGIDFLEFGSARIVRIVDLPGRPVPWGGPLAISPDGRRLLYPQIDAVASDIMLVENFR